MMESGEGVFFKERSTIVDVACNHESRHGDILVLHIFQSKNMAWDIVHYFDLVSHTAV
jgi:hypothetical protein